MAKLLKLRRGTTTQHASFTGAEGELTVDITKDTAVVHDGSTQAGRPLAREDMSNVSSANIAGQLGTDSIATTKIAAGALPTDVTVASANLVDGTIVNADVNASAAIAGTKISPDFGSQNITTTGQCNTGDITVTGTAPSIALQDSNNENDFAVKNQDGTFKIRDVDAGVDRFKIQSDGQVIVANNLAADAGIGVTGNISVSGTVDGRDVAADGTKLDGIESSATADQTAAEIRTLVESASDSNVFTDADHSKLNAIEASATADQTASEIVSLLSDQNIATTGTLGSGDITITDNSPQINFTDGDGNPDYRIRLNTGILSFTDTTNSADRIVINSDGHLDIAGNTDFGAGIDVTGNITATGTVDGRDVATDGTKLDGIEASATADQTDNEIRALVESAADSNVFTDADHTKLNGIEASATADQTAQEIATALNGQSIYTTGNIGRDSTDYIVFTNNTQMDVYVNGSNEFRFRNNGDFHADGDVYAYSTTTASDENLKKDIVTVTDAVTKVEALKGVTFKWNKNDADSAGVIAQDVEKVLPQVVKTVADIDGNEYKAVNYSGLTSILIEAIKDLSARVKVLEAK